MSARRLLLIAVAATLAACAAGCGGDSNDGPSTLPASTENASPTESTITSPVTSSADAAEAESAEQFIRGWWSLVDAALAGQGEVPVETYLPSCAYCAEIDETVTRNEELGQRTEGGGRTVKSVTVLGTDPDVQGSLFETVLDVAPGDIVNAEGSIVRSFPGGQDIKYIFNLRRSSNDWIIQDLIAQGPS